MIRALEAISLFDQEKSSSPGMPPRLDWVSLRDLVIDPSYQRDISSQGAKNIRAICKEFKWSKFSTVIVTALASGKYAIIDGQHRCTAALSLGYGCVPCQIVEASAVDAAGIFTAVNSRVTPLNVIQLYRAARKAGELWANSLYDASLIADCIIATHNVTASRMKPFETIAIGTLRQILNRHGGPHVSACLSALAASKNANMLGMINSKRLREINTLLLGHRGWTADLSALRAACAELDFTAAPVSDPKYEAQLSRRLGDGSSTAEMWNISVNKVRDLHTRKFSKSQIATLLKMPFADVERAFRVVVQEAVP